MYNSILVVLANIGYLVLIYGRHFFKFGVNMFYFLTSDFIFTVITIDEINYKNSITIRLTALN